MEYICDMSFWRKHYDYNKDIYSNDVLLNTYYNLFDLFASKENIKNSFDKRLEKTLKDNAFPRMMNHKIISYEPEYELIKKNYPDIQIGRKLDDRINRSLLPISYRIAHNGANISPQDKEWVKAFSNEAQLKKIEQRKKIETFRKSLKNKIKEEKFNTEQSLMFTKSYVLRWIEDRVNEYSKKENGFIDLDIAVDINKLEIEKECELFISIFSLYLLNDGGKYTPGPNDHIDLLTFLYVNPRRKVLMEDNRWSEIAASAGLEHYFGKIVKVKTLI